MKWRTVFARLVHGSEKLDFCAAFALFNSRPSIDAFHLPIPSFVSHCTIPLHFISPPPTASTHQDLLHAYTQAQRAEFELQFAAQQLESCDQDADPHAQTQALEAYEVAAAEQVCVCDGLRV